MLITFKVEVDSYNKEFTKEEIEMMKGLCNEFCSKLEQLKLGFVSVDVR